MVRFPEASARLFGNVFVCRRCKTKRRANHAKVLKGEIACRRCGGTVLRPIKKQKS